MTFNDFYFKPAYLVDSMHNKTHCPYVVTAHIRYTDFVNDYNCSGYPVLTSMIRDPADKLRSEFYFRRYIYVYSVFLIVVFNIIYSLEGLTARNTSMKQHYNKFLKKKGKQQ